MKSHELPHAAMKDVARELIRVESAVAIAEFAFAEARPREHGRDLGAVMSVLTEYRAALDDEIGRRAPATAAEALAQIGIALADLALIGEAIENDDLAACRRHQHRAGRILTALRIYLAAVV